MTGGKVSILRGAEDPAASYLKVDRNDLFCILDADFEANVKTAEQTHVALEDKIREAQHLQDQVQPQHIQALLGAYRETIFTNLINSFGLGPFLQQEKDGGNVQTLHNARNGAFANDTYRERYDQDFDRKNYEKNFPKLRKNILNSNQVLFDEYTGNELPKDGRAHLDHVVSAHEIHQNDKLRLFMSDDRRNEIATDPQNLAMTNSSLNQSKKDKDLLVWAEKESSKQDGSTNKEKYDVDMKKAKAKHQEARNHIEREQRKAERLHYTKEVLSTGVQEGVRMGVRQAAGLIFYEFVFGLYEEMKDYIANYKKYREQKTVLEEFGNVAKRVGERVLRRQQDMIGAFSSGFVSAFLSNLVTTIINCVFTTSKRMVRLIREGFYSFMRALKLLIFRPEGMSLREAAHESSKLLAVGLVTCGGIALEEAFQTFLLTTPFAPFAPLISGTLVGILTGIAATTVVYYIDQIGIFQESTDELVAETDRIVARTAGLQVQLAATTAGIVEHKDTTDYFRRLKKAEQNVNDIIDFFEE